MEKSKPHFGLMEIKVAFQQAARLNRTFSSRQGADALDLDDDDVVAVIQALKVADFEKSMTSNINHRVWQDVYKPVVRGKMFYVKFTMDASGSLLLISFKEA